MKIAYQGCHNTHKKKRNNEDVWLHPADCNAHANTQRRPFFVSIIYSALILSRGDRG